MPARRFTLGEDWQFSTILRDSTGTAKDLSSAGANITLFPYSGNGDVYTATLTVTPATGQVSADLAASGLYAKLKPGLFRYQVKLSQGGVVSVAEQGTVTVLGGSLGPDPDPTSGSSTLEVDVSGNAGQISSLLYGPGVFILSTEPLVGTVTGGIPPYTYAWTSDTSWASLAAPNSPTTFVQYADPPGEGTYVITFTLTVVDSVGAIATDTRTAEFQLIFS